MPPTGPPLVASLHRRLRILGWAGLAILGAQAATAPASSAQPVPPDHTVWTRPVGGGPGGAAILRGFDPPTEPWLAGHRGVDLAADPYSRVQAAATGTVAFAGPLNGRGVVSIAHSDGLRTTYEPVAALVSVGASVIGGEVIGLLEPLTAHCGRSCLHWGLRRGEDYLNPLSVLARSPPVLLPYGPPLMRPWLASLT